MITKMSEVAKKDLTLDTSKLLTIKNYASKIGKSIAWVRKLAESGQITLIQIDGVYFIMSK